VGPRLSSRPVETRATWLGSYFGPRPRKLLIPEFILVHRCLIRLRRVQMSRQTVPCFQGSLWSLPDSISQFGGLREGPQRARTKNSRQRRLVREDLPLRTPRRGSGKSGPISEEKDLSIELPTPASATAPAKDGFGRFRGSAACGADLVCLYRASPPPSTPWLGYCPVPAVPIPPCPATHGRRA
jgi:hypothetical protein